jgi:hypothetical protein
LPRTRKWHEVIELLDDGCDVETVAEKSLDASIADFHRAASDPGLVYSFWILTQLPTAGRSDDPVGALHSVGVPVAESLDALSLLTAVGAAVDRHREALGKLTDTGELARLAAVETLTKTLMEGTGSLFHATHGDVSATLRQLGSVNRFGALSRAFVAGFLQKHLTYYLSRELSKHVGIGKGLADIGAHAEFREALATHCREAARIMETFAGEWLSKRAYTQPAIQYADAKAFLHVAFDKLEKELRIRARP